MTKYFSAILLITFTMIVSCQLQSDSDIPKDPIRRFCGYQMSMTEFNQVASETFGNPNPFLVENSSETFLEIYDTVKNHVDSSMIYELTLVNLKRDEIWLDLKVPQGNMKNLEKIGCIIMNSHFSELVPEQIKIRLFERVNSLEIGRTRYIITGIKKVN